MKIILVTVFLVVSCLKEQEDEIKIKPTPKASYQAYNLDELTVSGEIIHHSSFDKEECNGCRVAEEETLPTQLIDDPNYTLQVKDRDTLVVDGDFLGFTFNKIEVSCLGILIVKGNLEVTKGQIINHGKIYVQGVIKGFSSGYTIQNKGKIYTCSAVLARIGGNQVENDMNFNCPRFSLNCNLPLILETFAVKPNTKGDSVKIITLRERTSKQLILTGYNKKSQKWEEVKRFNTVNPTGKTYSHFIK